MLPTPGGRRGRRIWQRAKNKRIELNLERWMKLLDRIKFLTILEKNLEGKRRQEIWQVRWWHASAQRRRRT